MRKKLFIKMSVLLVILALTAQISFAKDNIGGSKSLNKTLGTPGSTRLNINKISTLLNGNGYSDVSGSNPSYYYPTLSGKTANYESGLIFGAYLGPVSDNLQRICGSTYRTSLVPGRIISPGVADNAANENVRIYRVRRDYKTGSVSIEITDEAKSEADIRAQYEKDWNSWPAAWGAPFEDIGKLGSDGLPVKDAQGNNVKDGIYDPLIDIPGVPGADQTVWWVANDLNATQAATFSQTTPMGVEMQCTAWGYKQAGALGSMIFKKYMIINKNVNHKDFNNAYVSYWSDTDIGGGSFDYSACDTTLSLFYTYSSNNSNAQYGANPPATGFDFFQGPKVKTGNTKDTAIFNGKYLVGWKNLPMSAHYYFINSDATMADPDLNSALGIAQWYNLFQGKVAVTGAAFVDPDATRNPTKKATKFALNGDPVTKTGWLDGNPYAAADRRNGGVAGPFNVAYGDTQEVVIAQITAGASVGIDNIGAVSQLKDYDRTAQIAYNRLFKLPQPAPAPKLSISSFDQKLLLNWGDNSDAVKATESYNTFGYAFQGYNVYQLPTASSTIADGKLIKTFDIVDKVTSIIDKTTDAASGALVDYVSANGTDSGIQRLLELTNDAIHGSKLFNGSKYYFAVTSYSYNPNPPFGNKVLENPLTVITAIPNQPAPGVIYTVKTGDGITVTRASGASDGSVKVFVVDPSKVTGHQYEVSFANDAASKPVWNLKDLTTSKVVLTNQTNQNGDANSPLVDGLQVKVSGAPSDFKKFLVTANASGKLATPNMGVFAFNSSGFPTLDGLAPNTAGTNDRPQTGQQVAGGLWGIHTGNSGITTNTYASFLGRVERNDNFSRTVPYDFEIRFTAKGGKSEDYFGTGAHMDIPFEVWNTGIGTPNDTKDDYRVMPLIYDTDVDGKFGLTKTDHQISGADNDPETDWIYVYDVTDHTPGTKGYDAAVAANFDDDGKTTTIGGEIMARLVFVSLNAGSVSDPTYPANVKQQMIETGTIFRIETTKPNYAGSDVFKFTAPAVGYNADQAKLDVEKINVYPNPYYGINPQELTKYTRWVTFTHLPPKATLRIFNLAGQLVKTIVKDNSDQSQRWDLLNDSAFPVGNGLYIVHIDMPDLGTTKILKVAIIQEKQILDRF